jgi:hypothetical protein
MTIRADRSKVLDRVDPMLPTSLGDGFQVMDMNEAQNGLTIDISERETAGEASWSVVFNALLAGKRVALIRGN